MKNLQLTAICTCLTLSTILHASSRDGIYFGGGLGEVSDQYSSEIKNLPTQPQSIHSNNTVANFFTGYGNTLDNGFYLAGEVGSNYPGHSTKFAQLNTTVYFSNKSNIHDYLTLDVLSGYRFTELWLLYARTGLSYTHFDSTQSLATIPATRRINNNKVGARVGTGLNYAITNNLGIGLDYSHTEYQKNHIRFTGYSAHIKQHIRSNYLGLSVFYTIE
ncbi:MAG: outer membrane protein [Legionella sp.]